MHKDAGQKQLGEKQSFKNFKSWAYFTHQLFEPLEEDGKSHEKDDTDSDDDGGDDDDDDNDVDPDGDDDGGDKDKAQHSPTKPYEAQCSATHPFQALEPHADLQSPTAPCKAFLPSLQEP